MDSNAQKSLDKLIAALTELRNSNALRYAHLRENADSARVVPVIADKAVTALDAFLHALCFEAGLDGDDFAPFLLASDAFATFEEACSKAADERDAAHGTFIDYVMEHGGQRHKAVMGC